MADQPQHDNESFTQDNVSTGTEISTDNDVPANLHDGPDGVTQSGHTRRYCPNGCALIATPILSHTPRNTTDRSAPS